MARARSRSSLCHSAGVHLARSGTHQMAFVSSFVRGSIPSVVVVRNYDIYIILSLILILSRLYLLNVPIWNPHVLNDDRQRGALFIVPRVGTMTFLQYKTEKRHLSQSPFNRRELVRWLKSQPSHFLTFLKRIPQTHLDSYTGRDDTLSSGDVEMIVKSFSSEGTVLPTDRDFEGMTFSIFPVCL